MARLFPWQSVPVLAGGVWVLYTLVCGVLAVGAGAGLAWVAGRADVGWGVAVVVTATAGWMGPDLVGRLSRGQGAVLRRSERDGF